MAKTKVEINSAMVKEYGINAGASIVGIAASKDFKRAPDGYKPSDVLEGCLSVVVLGAPSPQDVLESIAEYTASRNTMLTRMTSIAKEVEKRIKANGHSAKAISSSGGKFVNGIQFGHISLKHAAEFAGLGLITRNYLLTNLQYGNLLWFSAVLTDAALVPDKKSQFEICDNCNLCVKECPSGALDNIKSFGKKKCDQFFKIVNKKLEIQCFKCRTVCPYRFGK